MRTIHHNVEFCVVGGGLSGMCAAIAAARHGVKTLLMHDRPMLGGNASSEIRMWVCGAHGANNLETGIIEEIQLENLYRNNYPNYSIWDSILYEKARFQKNLTLLLNCSCNGAEMVGDKIRSIKGWQLTSESWHVVRADYFADCSGDSILAPLTGADFRYGREARAEFDEDIEPDEADAMTMGMSCLIQARETDSLQPFIAPEWAHKYDEDSIPHRPHEARNWHNFWWLEIGGQRDTVHDAEEIRDELLKIAFGVWDHIKNGGDHGAENWVIDWLGFLPGKRESRRYVGDHIITQNDVRAEGRFDDLVAYGGWSMDDHHPAGFEHPGKPTVFHPAPSPYGIPYRSLYSKNIENLFFAGRNISATHAAMSSTRVMATCAILGQAVGVAAAIAAKNSLSPRGVYEQKIDELKQGLMEEDCYLPFNRRKINSLTQAARTSASSGDPEMLRNGYDRPIGEAENGWECGEEDWVEYAWDEPQAIDSIRLIFDSNLNRRGKNMPCSYPLDMPRYAPPETLVKDFVIEAMDADGTWRQVHAIEGNYQRLVRLPLEIEAKALRLQIRATQGAEKTWVFAWDVYCCSQ